MMRPDGREDVGKLRTLEAKVGLLNKPDGSAQFSCTSPNNAATSVLCSVYGPVEPLMRDEKLDKATVIVDVEPLSGPKNTSTTLLQYHIRQILTPLVLTALHPRTAISLTFQIMADDGGVLAACINSGIFALMDAGIPLKSLVAAISIGILSNGLLIIDPCEAECEGVSSLHMFALEGRNDQVGNTLGNLSVGVYSRDDYVACHDVAKSAVAALFQFMRQTMQGKIVGEIRIPM
ncbi:hypothetical protein SeLEV6574_g00401 [Synchytrium endobioticum]|nr:hypothetical protein SeLEV6574_g00401 [Synchytrium endobioticum]